MPHFFNKDKLTKIQEKNWDHAITEYKRIQSIYVDKRLETLTENEKTDLIEKTNSLNQNDWRKPLQLQVCLLMNNPGDEKSALFARLLEGKKAFIYAPPKSYSYPWYSVIEENKGHEIMHEGSLDEILSFDDKKINQYININQCLWNVVSIVSSTEVLVSYPNWQDLGYVWRLKYEKVACRDTSSFICSHHNSELKRITTLTELKLECEWHVLKQFFPIQLVLDENLKIKRKEEIFAKYNENYGIKIFEEELKIGNQLLEARRIRNLTDYPTSEEIEQETQKSLKSYFDKNYSADENDNLYTEVWNLSKISPEENSDSIYM